MTIANATIPVPLGQDPDGTIRVGGTRVTLDVVIHAHQDGAAPEQIVEMYDVLRLGDVYAVITYYLAHRTEIDAYLHRRGESDERLRKEFESQPGYQAFIERVRARARERGGSA